MQGILQTIQGKNFNNDTYDVLETEFKGLQEDFANLSSKEIFNSYWLQNGLEKSNDIISKINLTDFNLEEIKKNSDSGVFDTVLSLTPN